MTQLTIITKQKKSALLHLEITNEIKREEKSILICRVYFFSWNEKPGTIWTIFVKAG